jgi:hypothetical protein
VRFCKKNAGLGARRIPARPSLFAAEKWIRKV